MRIKWILLKFRNLWFEKDGAENEQIREIR
jgi:hypothetical protein